MFPTSELRELLLARWRLLRLSEHKPCTKAFANFTANDPLWQRALSSTASPFRERHPLVDAAHTRSIAAARIDTASLAARGLSCLMRP